MGSFKKIPMAIWSIFYLTVAAITSPAYYWIAGLAMFIESVFIFQHKLLPNSWGDLFTPVGLGTIMIFLAGLFLCVAYIFGDYTVPLFGFLVTRSLATIVGLTGIMLFAVQFGSE